MNESQSNLELEKLRQWRAELSSKADALRGEIQERAVGLDHIEEQLSLLIRLIELNGGSGGTAQPEKDNVSPFRYLSSPNGSRSFEDEVEMVIKEHGKPMHISAIRSALVKAGCPIPGRGDDANIIVRMRNHPNRFTRTARGTYSLAEWGLPELKTARRSRASRSSR